MNRSLKLSLLLALGLVGTQVSALELGQIQVKSALGQPLLAEIPLTPESPAELHNLSARLASSEDFARAGISGGRPTIALHFSIASDGGHKVIRITSSEPVSDPYLDLLVEVDSAAGKSVREFAILLDPPGMGPAPSQPATSSAARVASTPPAASSAPRATSGATGTSGASSPATHAATAGNGQIGPVARGQTLTSIVRQNTPPGISENQMLVAFKQANPGAFYRDNVNALKSGVVLRVPTSEEAQALGAAAALAEIRRENSDWRAGATRSPTAVADAGTRAETSSAPTSAAGKGDRLALVPAKQGGGNGDGGTAAGKPGAAAAMAQLRQDLARNQETVSTMQAQGNELKSRVKDLEDINGKNQRLLSLKDNEIADLQHQLEKARKAGQLPATAGASGSAPATAAVATTPAAEKPAAAPAAVAPAASASVAQTPTTSPATAQSANTAPATSGTAAAVAATTPAMHPATKPAPLPAPAVDEAPWYMQTWAWAAGGAAIVLLLLLALLGRRRKPASVTGAAPSLADRFGAMPATAGGDPDEEELLDQLAEHPDDIQLHLELATLYYSRGDVEHFEAAAEAMHAHIADPEQPEWQDIVRMGEDLAPSHPLFAAPVEGQAAHDGYTAHDDYADELPGDHHAPFDEEVDPLPAAPPLPPQQKNLGGYHFDFNLTGPRAHEDHPHGDEEVTRIAVPHASTAFDDEPIGDTPLHADGQHAPFEAAEPETASSWNFEEPETADSTDAHAMFEGSAAAAPVPQFGQFSDDPVDTKLDLARAYMDMGDAEGARAMLEEVQQEGNQMQRDAARHLLENIH